MTLSLLAVVILFSMILISALPRVNGGLLSLAVAGFFGCFIARLRPVDVLLGFPVSMFLILTAVSYFFGIARCTSSLIR